MRKIGAIVGLLAVLSATIGFQTSRFDTYCPGPGTVGIGSLDELLSFYLDLVPDVRTLSAVHYDADDVGWLFCQLGSRGESLITYVGLNTVSAPKLQIAGPYARLNLGGDIVQFWCAHSLGYQHSLDGVSYDQDFQMAGPGRSIFDIDSSWVSLTADRIERLDSWSFTRASSRDTLRITRRAIQRKGQMYIVYRYSITRLNIKQPSDTIRIFWYDEPWTGLASLASRHNVGYVPAWGRVFRSRRFAARSISACACMVEYGNPAAAIDTLADGSQSYGSAELKRDIGGGCREWIGAFIAWNMDTTRVDIVPDEFVYVDQAPTSLSSWHFDSTAVNCDTTDVLDSSNSRYLAIRTRKYIITNADTLTFEFAVGAARVADDCSIHVPRVYWSDGSYYDFPLNR